MLVCQLCIKGAGLWITVGLLIAQPMISQTGVPHSGASSVKTDTSTALARDFQKRFMHMSKRYKLSAVQQAQVRSILLKEQLDQETVFGR